MANTTADFAKSLEPLTGKWFASGMSRIPAQYREVFRVDSMGNRSYIEDALIVGTGLLRETAQGAPVNYDSIRQGYVARYTATKYTSGLIITKEAIEDGINLDLVRRQSEFLGRSAAETIQTVAFNVLNRAFSGSYLGGDGVALCSASHATVSGNLSNTVSLDLSEAALETIDTNMRAITDDRGLRLSVKAQKLIVPRALKFDAHRILKSSLRSGTSDNDANAVNDLNMFPQGTLVVDYLTDDDAFFVLTNESEQGLRFLSRTEPTMASDSDFDTSNVKFKIETRFATGWTNWRHVYGSQGA